MNVQHIQFSPEDAAAALREYKQHRGSYDKADWEIERIYREIARGKTVMSALQAIRDGGLDEFGRSLPRLWVGADTERNGDPAGRLSCERGFGAALGGAQNDPPVRQQIIPHFAVKKPRAAVA